MYTVLLIGAVQNADFTSIEHKLSLRLAALAKKARHVSGRHTGAKQSPYSSAVSIKPRPTHRTFLRAGTPGVAHLSLYTIVQFRCLAPLGTVLFGTHLNTPICTREFTSSSSAASHSGHALLGLLSHLTRLRFTTRCCKHSQIIMPGRFNTRFIALLRRRLGSERSVLYVAMLQIPPQIS